MRALVLIALLAVHAACAHPVAPSPVAAAAASSTTGATRAFPDNPMVDLIPAETPYAFATFKPVPLDVMRKLAGMAGPTWRHSFDRYMAEHPGSPGDAAITAALVDELEHLSLDTMEPHGFTPRARFAVYGIGAYPVFRAELASGSRVFTYMKDVARRARTQLPPSVERAGRRYWWFGTAASTILVALGPTELVVAVAPRALLDANLATILGEQRPTDHLTSAQFRALAARDGFSAQGVGYADLARIGTLVAAGSSAACTAAVTGLAARVPRIALGYEDFTTAHFNFGMVLELVPALVDDVRGVARTLVGVERALGKRHAMAMIAAVDLVQAQRVAGDAAEALKALGRSCKLDDLVTRVTEVADRITQPLPPILAGLHGGYLAVDDFEMGPSGPVSGDGFGMIELDSTDELLKLVTSFVPDLQPDLLPRPLPALVPFPWHVATSSTAFGIGVGRDSAKQAVAGLTGTRAPAPLAEIVFDYTKLGDLLMLSDLLITRTDPDAEIQRAMFKALGRFSMRLVVDRRGLVMWMAAELR